MNFSWPFSDEFSNSATCFAFLLTLVLIFQEFSDNVVVKSIPNCHFIESLSNLSSSGLSIKQCLDSLFLELLFLVGVSFEFFILLLYFVFVELLQEFMLLESNLLMFHPVFFFESMLLGSQSKVMSLLLLSLLKSLVSFIHLLGQSSLKFLLLATTLLDSVMYSVIIILSFLLHGFHLRSFHLIYLLFSLFHFILTHLLFLNSLLFLKSSLLLDFLT